MPAATKNTKSNATPKKGSIKNVEDPKVTKNKAMNADTPNVENASLEVRALSDPPKKPSSPYIIFTRELMQTNPAATSISQSQDLIK
jgi:hypothetical protein